MNTGSNVCTVCRHVAFMKRGCDTCSTCTKQLRIKRARTVIENTTEVTMQFSTDDVPVAPVFVYDSETSLCINCKRDSFVNVNDIPYGVVQLRLNAISNIPYQREFVETV